MAKYLIEYSYNEKFNAGSKARDDIRNIMESEGYKTVLLQRPKNIYEKLIHMIRLDRKIENIEDKSIICIQWPLASKKYILPIIKKLKGKGCKIITLIHDITTLRNDRLFKDNDEIEILNLSDSIIAHNDAMKKYLISKGIRKHINVIEIFDYLISDQKINKKTNKLDFRTVVFAGNLSSEKSGFLYKIQDGILEKININLYGANVEKLISKNINYKGKYKPDELVCNLEGDYGLVWDGTSIDKCDGVLGEYLKINNPHKSSLYIAAELPIITWKDSALSDFVTRNKIGVVIEKLTELNNIKVSSEEYNNMKNNVIKIKNKIINGYYTKKAIEKSIEFIEQ